jgi:hypothetical protein
VPASLDPSTPPEPGADDAYRRALEEDTLPAWSRYLERHANAPEAEAARRRAAVLREQAAYRTALARNDAAGYLAFLRHFPDSDRRPEAEARLRTIDAAGQTSQSEEAFRAAFIMGTEDAWVRYLARWPEGARAREAREALASLRARTAETRRGRVASEP